MKKDILNTIIRFSEESKNDADAVYYPNFEKLAKELDALFAKRIVSHRRELLIDLLNWYEETFDYLPSSPIYHVDEYLKEKGNL